MGIRRLTPDAFMTVEASRVDPISVADFDAALRIIRPSVSPESLRQYTVWNSEFGSKIGPHGL
jgi:hypothetical protein